MRKIPVIPMMQTFIFLIGCYMFVILYSFFWVNNFDKYIKIDKNFYSEAKNPALQDYPKNLAINTIKDRPVKYSFNLGRITAYTNSVKETDRTPFNTSCGHVNDVKYKYIIALSRDLFFRDGYKWLCGKHATIVYSDGTRVEGVIYDTMNARYRKSADVLIRKNNLISSRKAAFKHGVNLGKVLIY